MPIIGGAIGIGAPIIGGIVGNIAASGDKEKAEEAYRRALENISGIAVPDQKALDLQSAQFTGGYNPVLEEAISMGPSAMEGISVDPRLRDAQMMALARLEQYGTEGLSAEEQADLNAMHRDVSADAQARQSAIIQNLQARGMGGAGVELAAQLDASQKGAQRASESSDRLAAMEQQRQLQAILNAGQLGGSLRTQEFNEDSSKAQAADAIAQWNAAQKAQAQTRNVGALTGARQYVTQGSQAAENARAQARQQESAYNVEAPNRSYQQQLQKGQLMSGLESGAADRATQEANATRAMWSQIGSGIGQGGATLAAANMKKPETTVASDERLKEKIKQGSQKIRDFLDELEPHTYEYKDPEKYGEGERAGVMAQELEKSELGSEMVKDTPDGKMVDFGRGMSAILAAQADLNKRLKAIENKVG